MEAGEEGGKSTWRKRGEFLVYALVFYLVWVLFIVYCGISIHACMHVACVNGLSRGTTGTAH